MHDTNDVAFSLMLDALAEAFNTTLSATRKLAYWGALEDIPLDALQRACDLAIRHEEFFPVPAKLRKLAGYDSAGLPPAEAAWQRLRNVQHRYNREALADPLTREVFEAMGGGYVLEWGFGNWPLEQEDRKRREFISRYHEAQHARAIAAGQRQAPRRLTDGGLRHV